MERQLRETIICILEQCKDGSPYDVNNPNLNDEEYVIYRLLKDNGYLTKGPKTTSFSYTSFTGHAYLERLKAPRRAWLKDNWFPVTVAGITVFIALASVIVQIVGLILD